MAGLTPRCLDTRNVWPRQWPVAVPADCGRDHAAAVGGASALSQRRSDQLAQALALFDRGFGASHERIVVHPLQSVSTHVPPVLHGVPVPSNGQANQVCH